MLTVKLYIPGWDWLTHDIRVSHRRLGVHVVTSIQLDSNMLPHRKTRSVTLGLIVVNLTLAWDINLGVKS